MNYDRRVNDDFLGRPILEIPQTHPIENTWVDLSVEERLIYQYVHGLLGFLTATYPSFALYLLLPHPQRLTTAGVWNIDSQTT